MPATLDLVFCLGFFGRLPLHVTLVVGATHLERGYVIDHVTVARPLRLTCGWTRLLALEVILCCLRALNTSIGSAFDCRLRETTSQNLKKRKMS